MIFGSLSLPATGNSEARMVAAVCSCVSPAIFPVHPGALPTCGWRTTAGMSGSLDGAAAAATTTLASAVARSRCSLPLSLVAVAAAAAAVAVAVAAAGAATPLLLRRAARHALQHLISSGLYVSFALKAGCLVHGACRILAQALHQILAGRFIRSGTRIFRAYL